MDAEPRPASPDALDLSHNYQRFGVGPPEPVNKPPTNSDIVAAILFAGRAMESDASSDAKVEAVRYAYSLTTEHAEARDLPHWAQQQTDSLEAIRNDLKDLHNMFSADISEIKAVLQEVREDVKVVREDVKVLKEDVKVLKEDVDEMKTKMVVISRFTNTLQVERAKHANMVRPRPDNLQQVPGPHGALPWNESIQGPNGETIVLTPLVSLHAVQALGADELGAYIQFYYPDQEVPADLTERKRLLLRAIGRPSESHEML